MREFAAYPQKMIARAHQPPSLALLVDSDDPLLVFAEVEKITRTMLTIRDCQALKTVCGDILTLFSGSYPGYRACNTPYHDLRHTTDTFLAMARLLHGARIQGVPIMDRDILLGLIAALMHDVGYIQHNSERQGTGARFASTHIRRGIRFMKSYLGQKGYSAYEIGKCGAAIQCTDLDLPLSRIRFRTNSNRHIGKLLATADLLGQTSDRCYLEKLRFLFHEFTEAGNNVYKSELNLLQDSLNFNHRMYHRLSHELGAVHGYAIDHFMARWKIEKNLYMDSIENNIKYLSYFLRNDPQNYNAYLRRMCVP